ncbi:unnamed protein product, partial [Ectocarpus fasciculatus]
PASDLCQQKQLGPGEGREATRKRLQTTVAKVHGTTREYTQAKNKNNAAATTASTTTNDLLRLSASWWQRKLSPQRHKCIQSKSSRNNEKLSWKQEQHKHKQENRGICSSPA